LKAAGAMSGKVVFTVGVSDMKISNDPGSVLITYALGSCIGLVVYDPIVHLGGLLHFQLPDSKGFEDAARENPYKFADTGVAALFEVMYSAGAHKNRLVIGIFGGGNMMQDEKIFQIGVRNARASKKILWQNSLFIKYEDVGGTTNRTVSLDLETGRIRMKKDGEVIEFPG
jgi:chemotaxis protein CheD